MRRGKKMKITTVLLDLDGTITDSGPGIMNSVRHALKKIGMEHASEEELRRFIGPPLKTQFMEFCGVSAEKADWLVEQYREYYKVKGIFENSVYDGIEELLKGLKAAGMKVMMATSKPEKFAKIIAEHFEFAQYFDFIGGACMDETRTKKLEVIEYVLESCGIKERDSVLMVGDRSYDIEGAHQAGMKAMGVLYGYGTMEELEIAGADYIVETPEEALNIILND